MSYSSWVHVDAEIKAETDKAFLLEIDGEQVWIPKSQIADAKDYKKGDKGSISVSEWFAEKEGLEGS